MIVRRYLIPRIETRHQDIEEYAFTIVLDYAGLVLHIPIFLVF